MHTAIELFFILNNYHITRDMAHVVCLGQSLHRKFGHPHGGRGTFVWLETISSWTPQRRKTTYFGRHPISKTTPSLATDAPSDSIVMQQVALDRLIKQIMPSAARRCTSRAARAAETYITVSSVPVFCLIVQRH